jgi:hypothetical protein
VEAGSKPTFHHPSEELQWNPALFSFVSKVRDSYGIVLVTAKTYSSKRIQSLPIEVDETDRIQTISKESALHVVSRSL